MKDVSATFCCRNVFRHLVAETSCAETSCSPSMLLHGEGSEATEPNNKYDKIRPHSIRSLQFDQKVRPLSFRPEKFDLFTATPSAGCVGTLHIAPRWCSWATGLSFAWNCFPQKRVRSRERVHCQWVLWLLFLIARMCTSRFWASKKFFMPCTLLVCSWSSVAIVLMAHVTCCAYFGVVWSADLPSPVRA